MADVPTTLCRLGPSAFGIAHGASSDSLIVTLQGDGILEYDTSSKERTAGWSLGSSRLRFVSAVVFNTKSQAYFAAVSNADKAHQVLSWQANAPAGTLDRLATKVNLPKPVHSIHPATCSPRLPGAEGIAAERPSGSATDSTTSTSGREEHGGVFVVFTDGSVALESYYSNGRKGESIAGQGGVVAVSCHRGKLAVLTVGERMSHVVAVYGFVDGELALLGSSPLTPPGDATAASSISLRGQALSVLWSQGTLCSHYMYPNTQAHSGFSLRLQASRRLAGMEEASPQPKTSARKNGKKPEKVTGKRKSAVLDNGGLEQQGVVVTAPGSIIATVNWLGEEKAGRKRLRLNVVDGMYGTARRTQELPLPDPQAGAAAKAQALEAIHMGSDSQQVAILAEGSVLLAQLQDAPPTLASLVGALSLGGRSPLQKAAKAAFHAEEWPKMRPPTSAGRARPAWLPGVDARDALPQETLLEIAVPLEPRDDGGAASASDEDLHREAGAQHDAVCAPSTYATPESAAALVDHLLQSAVGGKGPRLKQLPLDLFSHLLLCLAEKGLWEEVERVMGARPVTSLAHTPGLLPLLSAAGQHRLVAKILPLVRDATLEDLQPALEGLLALDAEAPAPEDSPHLGWQRSLREAASRAQAAAQTTQDGTAGNSKLHQEAVDCAAVVDGFSATECLLHPFVATGVDSRMLVSLLRRLGMRPCLHLATYLLTWLNRFLETGASQKGRLLAGGGCLPALRRVIQWCGALIDAHLIAFSSDQGAAQMAVEMQKAVAAHRSAIPSLSPLLGMVDHIRRRGPPPQSSRGNSLYSVELLDLTITD